MKETVRRVLDASQELVETMAQLREQMARRAGATRASWRVLAAATGQGRTVPHWRGRLGVKRQSVQRLADQLVRVGPGPVTRPIPIIVDPPSEAHGVRRGRAEDAPARAHRLGVRFGRRARARARGARDSTLRLARGAGTHPSVDEHKRGDQQSEARGADKCHAPTVSYKMPPAMLARLPTLLPKPCMAP